MARRALTNIYGSEAKSIAWTGEYDPSWYAEQALALGYISADQVTTLLGDDEHAAVDVMRTIWDFTADPISADGGANWSLDWPLGTPVDQVGPGRWRRPVRRESREGLH